MEIFLMMIDNDDSVRAAFCSDFYFIDGNRFNKGLKCIS